jgi:biopolymer transport protein ExbD
MGMTSSSGPNINVTPLIDVLLVLLVIFLVIIPVMVKVETVDLPPAEPNAESVRLPVVIKLRADASALVDDGAPIMAADLWSKLKPRVSAGATVFVDFEDGVPWSDVVGTVDGVRGLAADPDSVRVAVRIREPE